jgi:hypothetical protein
MNGVVKNRVRWVGRLGGGVAVLICGLGIAGCQIDLGAQERTEAAQEQEAPKLIIENDEALPETYPYGRYEVRMLARGGATPLHWKVETGLPPGIKLEDDGLLHGAAERAGDFQFTVAVSDSGGPRLTATKTFRLRATSTFTLEWKNVARVSANRIEGSAQVTNTTADDIDLTFVVLAVAGNGRATAIGYQHFMLPRATVAKELPFGETLPPGAYMVHVDAVGEVAAKKLILRQRMQTPGALQVVVGP